MKKYYTNQEILLMPASNFFRRDWCEKDVNAGNKKLSEKEKLIQLCWDGMIPEILPEIKEITRENKPLTLWEVNETDRLLDLRMGQLDDSMDDAFSINPYIAMHFASQN